MKRSLIRIIIPLLIAFWIFRDRKKSIRVAEVAGLTDDSSSSPEPRRPSRFRSVPTTFIRTTLFITLGVTVGFVTLFAGGIATNKLRAVPVLSGSMQPMLERGDVALLTKLPTSQLRSGDVVVYRAPLENNGALIVHRVVGVQHNAGKTGITTKGDANNAVDPWTADIESPTVWRVQGHIPHLASVAWTMNSSFGRGVFAFIIVPAFIGEMLKTIWARRTTTTSPLRRPRRPIVARKAIAGAMVIGVLLQADPATALFTSTPASRSGSFTTTTIASLNPTAIGCNWTSNTETGLSWTANASTLIDGYDVTSSATSGGPYTSLAAIPGRTSTGGGPFTPADPTNTFLRVQSTRAAWRSTPNPSEIPTVSCTRTINNFASPPQSGVATSLAGTFRAMLTDGTNVYASDVENDVIWRLDTTAGTLHVFAGNFSQTFAGDGGLATNASLAQPYGLAFDTTKANMYIADATNHRIRKIDMGTNIISTIAGTGTAGSTGDTGAATAARLNTPGGVALDSSNNVFIADSSNNKIRRIDAVSGVISTYAGTGTASYTGNNAAATSATMNAPQGVAVDAGNNVYIADTTSSAIRKVDAGTGIITTVAGTGTAGFTNDNAAATTARINRPNGLTVDGAGNIYIADSTNNRIRKVTNATGIITTIAGSATAGFLGDGGAATSARTTTPYAIALDGSGGYLFSDFGNRRIRRVDNTNTISTVAGNGFLAYSGDGGTRTSVQLDRPGAMVVDSVGNLFVADTSNCVVRKIDAGGIVSTVAGNGSCAVTSGDGGPALAAGIRGPTAIRLDPGETGLYISDTTSHRVRKVTFASGNIDTVAGTGATAFTADGSVATATNLNAPRGLTVAADGTIYVAETGNHRIRKFTEGGTVSTVAGTGTAGSAGDNGLATSATVNSPYDVAIDPGQNYLYIAEYGGHRVRRITLDTGIITLFAGNGTAGYLADGVLASSTRINQPQGLAVDATGNVYIADTTNHRIRVVTPVTRFIYTVTGSGTAGWLGDGGPAVGAAGAVRINSPLAVAVINPAGDLYVADSLGHRIRFVGR